MITKMTPETTRAIQSEARAALEHVAEKHGLSLIAKCGSYDPHAGEVTVRFEFKVKIAADGIPQERKDFERLAPLFGLEAADYGAELTFRGQVYRLVGIEQYRHKYPFLVERLSDGKRVLFTESMVRLEIEVLHEARRSAQQKVSGIAVEA